MPILYVKYLSIVWKKTPQLNKGKEDLLNFKLTSKGLKNPFMYFSNIGQPLVTAMF
jgi:hypothetical protein